MITKEEAKRKISELVERFEEQYASYKNADYNETLTRRDFIDPFFKALGWDIDNEQGYAEAYREVIHEDRVKVGSATKAPDYSFRIGGGKRLFFVEAKKPSIAVKDDMPAAYQVRRYGWSAKLAVSIITDFDEFSIYDCTKKPVATDKASVARIKYIQFKDYLNEFDFIWDTFSKEKVLKGSFDKFVQGTANKKGTATVDKEFLQSLDSWRTYLATSISWNNKELDEDEINFAVQQTIDRIIFLRIAEDRSIEPYGNLKNALAQGDYYKNLFSIFREADDKYNSGLFDFKKDQISPQLKIDNKVIKTIVNELYYPESPYEFSVLSVEILGSAYEQFLGKVIRITPAHHAKIEEKPEVRKAGGVYYTPQYIVEYIVKNTVGKLLGQGGMPPCLTPKEVSNLKIVDPACGSGSFLIGAYQYLLDWHKEYYHQRHAELVSASGKKGEIPKRVRNDLPLTPEGNLTTAEKKRILLNNIYGVDIDVNAVEVTKLSLLLKCMEGETQASISHQLSMFHERVLPTLDNNIKSGNSLIDTDYYDSQLDFGDERKIKPFNWQKAFPEVFKDKIIDEELKMFHVTCVMHNSRSSQRMIQYKVKKGDPEYLSIEEEENLIGIICKHIKEYNLKILSLNLCADHLHFVLVCNPEKLPFVVGKLKSMTAREFNIWRGVTQTRGHAPLPNAPLPEDATTQTRGHAPLPNAPLPEHGDTQFNLWAQKFNRVEIETDQQLANAIDYITDNRLKHVLPPLSDSIRQLISETLIEYNKAFEPIIIKGGFDAVIGNPPYVRQELLGDQKVYFEKHYRVFHGMADLYSYFIEKGIGLLNEKGIFGIIVANKWMRSNYGEPLRKWFKQQSIQEIIDFGDLPVFQSATTYPCILVASKSNNNNERISITNIKTLDFESLQNYVEQNQDTILQNSLDDKGWNLASETENNLLNKLKQNTVALGEYVKGKIYYGIKTGLNEAFVIDETTKNKLIEEDARSAEIIKPFLAGRDIKRYQSPVSDKYLIFFPKGFTNKQGNNPKNGWKWLQENYPAITNHLMPFEEAAKKRFDKGEYWWELRACDYYAEFEKPKISWGNLCKEPPFTLIKVSFYINAPSVFIPIEDYYLLGLMNSQVFWYLLKTIAAGRQGGFIEAKPMYVSKLPVKYIDSTNKTEKQQHDEIVTLVDQLLHLNRELTSGHARLQTRQEQLQTKIGWCEQRINQIVYQLYGLTEEEIKIVEG